MKVQKYEISRTIDKLKSIVQKNDQFPALGGVLVKDGYLIASNTEMTMQLKLEASKGSCFIIPMKAFDVIENLPDGEVIIDADGKNIVTIKTKAIKNKYQSYPPEEFSFDITEDLDAPEVVINGKRMMEAIGHVIYAAADSSSATQMMGVYFEGGENKIKLVALDGHVVAVDSIPTDGTADMKLIVPKTVAKKLVSMGIIDDVAVTYTKNRAVFKSKEYTIYTRLIEGKYFDYNRFFMAGKMKTYVSRLELVAAMTRAKMCTEEKKPAVFEMNEDQLNIRIADRLTDYQEEVKLQDPLPEPLKIGFDSKLVLETLKAFTCENIAMNFSGPKMPAVVEAEDSNDKRGIKTMIEILDMKDVKDATPEELEELRRKGFLPKTRSKRISGKPLTPYERTRAQVAATGNRWAMENFYATHS